MSRPKIVLPLLAAALLTACENQAPGGIAHGPEIALGAEIAAHSALSPARASYAVELSSYPFTAAVWFSTTPGDYSTTPASATTNVPSHITMTFNNSSQVYALTADGKNLRYSSLVDKVYCVGLYPATAWAWDETSPSVTSHNIDGTQDLMFAHEITGDWTNRFGSPLKFGHLLTWVKVEAVATSHDAVEQWGKITSLKINSQPAVEINLAAGTSSFSGADTDFDVLSGDGALDITSRMVASVFCSPKKEYTLKVTTERFPEITVPVTLTDENGGQINDVAALQGKNVVITLYFGNVIVEGKCVLSAWSEENEDLHVYN